MSGRVRQSTRLLPALLACVAVGAAVLLCVGCADDGNDSIGWGDEGGKWTPPASEWTPRSMRSADNNNGDTMEPVMTQASKSDLDDLLWSVLIDGERLDGANAPISFGRVAYVPVSAVIERVRGSFSVVESRTGSSVEMFIGDNEVPTAGLLDVEGAYYVRCRDLELYFGNRLSVSRLEK